MPTSALAPDDLRSGPSVHIAGANVATSISTLLMTTPVSDLLGPTRQEKNYGERKSSCLVELQNHNPFVE